MAAKKKTVTKVAAKKAPSAKRTASNEVGTKKPSTKKVANRAGSMSAKKPAAKAGPPATIDAYLATVPPDAQRVLSKLRKAIQAAAPKAVEAISYGVPAFKLDGSPLVSFGAAKEHCALYVMSPKVMVAHAADLEGYDTSKGAIRFPMDEPLADALVKKLVKARIAEQAARKSKK